MKNNEPYTRLFGSSTSHLYPGKFQLETVKFKLQQVKGQLLPLTLLQTLSIKVKIKIST